jgi:pimeloyl-ACP methyl ester carboxylesterase
MRTEPDPWLEQYGARRRTPRGRRRLRAVVALAALACGLAAVVIVLTGRHGGWKPPSGLGGFHDCTYGGRVAARCGELRVPEDESRPGGAEIALHVAIIPATRQPARGALFYLEGGPGGAGSEAAVKVSEVFAKVSEFRDLVLVDQRGTGGSHASTCPQEHVRAADARAVAAYVRRCFARLGGEARFLTSEAAAEDLERVRRALGYGRIDVYGSSYGATLAQLYLRLHPRSVRTATLDGASLTSVAVYELAARNAEHALHVDIARCHARQPACRRAFPDPRGELGRVLAERPGSARALAATVATLLRSVEDTARVPLLIHEAAGDAGGALLREHSVQMGSELDARARLAMFWTILCGDSWARFGVAATAAASRGSFLAPANVARARLFQRACAGVPEEPARPEGPWKSAVPVLLLAGSADPVDPPANLRGWRRTFPRGLLVTVPGLAHGVVAYGCVRLVVARFVAAGDTRGLDARCARRVPLPAFELS